MAVSILTNEDIRAFKNELFAELRTFLRNEVPQEKKWIRNDETKRLLQVSPGTLQTLRINGTLQYTKLGGIIYYDYEHIKKTFKENMRPGKQ